MNELRILVSAALLSTGVAALVAVGFARHAADAGPGVASVRLAELVAEHAARAARDDRDTEESAAATRAWAQALEDALGRVAVRHDAVLLPARAVAAGAPDLTAEVRTALARTVEGRNAADPELRP